MYILYIPYIIYKTQPVYNPYRNDPNFVRPSRHNVLRRRDAAKGSIGYTTRRPRRQYTARDDRAHVYNAYIG